jgi:hypothetical protein
MNRVTELSEYIEDSELMLTARISADSEDWLEVTAGCAEWNLPKKDLRAVVRFLNAVLKEAP